MWRKLRPRRIWMRSLSIGPLVMLVAFLANASYYDHWSEHFGWTHEEHESVAAEEAHQGHCHLNPSTCSDQPLPPGPKMTWEIVEVKEPNLSSQVTMLETERAASGFIVAIPTQPPQSI